MKTLRKNVLITFAGWGWGVLVWFRRANRPVSVQNPVAPTLECWIMDIHNIYAEYLHILRSLRCTYGWFISYLTLRQTSFPSENITIVNLTKIWAFLTPSVRYNKQNLFTHIYTNILLYLHWWTAGAWCVMVQGDVKCEAISHKFFASDDITEAIIYYLLYIHLFIIY